MLSAINYVLFNRTASKHAELTGPPLFWPVNCIKYGRNKLHDRVALLFLPCSVYKMLELFQELSEKTAEEGNRENLRHAWMFSLVT